MSLSPVAARHSRRRAIGAVRGLASRALAWAPGVTGRRALRGYRGRTETPQQNSQRVLLAITHGALPGRRDGDIAPYRHYTRVVRTTMPHARALPPLHTRGAHANPKKLCTPIHPAQKLFVPLCVKNSHDHGARALPGRRDGRRPGLPARALPPLHPQKSHHHFTRAYCLRWLTALPVGAPHSVAGLPTMLRRWRAQRIRREFHPSPMWRARHTRPRHVQCFPATGAREHADCPPYHRETSHRT